MATEQSCPNCGGTPMGEGCYHICFNSVHYYSPEQERYDDQFYGDDDMSERYAATIESMQYEGIPYDDEDDEYIARGKTGAAQETRRCVIDSVRFDPDDIPF